jgi:hypothetical protein
MRYVGEKRKKKKKNPGSYIGYSPERYECEEDLRALARAEAVKKDPARMEAVKKLAKEKLEESKKKEDEAKVLVDLGEGKEI